jgi:hypothetical protein
MFLSQRHGFFSLHDPELATIVADHANRTDANLAIDANAFGSVLNGNVSLLLVKRQAAA